MWDAIEAVAASLSALLAGAALLVSANVSKELHRDQQNQQLIPIWKEMLQIRRIAVHAPDAEQMRLALNLLGLVATCDKLQIVAPETLNKMFKDVYLSVRGDIAATAVDVTIGGVTQPGRDFVNGQTEIEALYRRWSA
jgi:hypothetical protein